MVENIQMMNYGMSCTSQELIKICIWPKQVMIDQDGFKLNKRNILNSKNQCRRVAERKSFKEKSEGIMVHKVYGLCYPHKDVQGIENKMSLN